MFMAKSVIVLYDVAKTFVFGENWIHTHTPEMERESESERKKKEPIYILNGIGQPNWTNETIKKTFLFKLQFTSVSIDR